MATQTTITTEQVESMKAFWAWAEANHPETVEAYEAERKANKKQRIEITAKADAVEVTKRIKAFKKAVAEFEDGADIDVLYHEAWQLAELF